MVGKVQTLWDQNTRAVYNRLGRAFGYTDSDQQLASGKVMVFEGEQVAPYSEWHVKDLGIDTPAVTYLVKRGLQPSWISKADAQDIKTQTNKGVLSDILPPLDLSALSFEMPDFDNPFVQATGQVTKFGTYAIWGGVGLLALVVLTRRK